MEQQIDTQTDNFMGIANPDAPIYRFFPLWFFHEALRLRQLVLIAPALWEDPYEDLAQWTMVTRRNTQPHTQTHLASYLKPAYAQCWSYTQESDTLLRAYSKVE